MTPLWLDILHMFLTSSLRHQQSSHLAGAPSTGEIKSFFRFLEASFPPRQPQTPEQQQPEQRPVPLAAAADAVLFLAGCAMSPHCGLRISKATRPHSELGETTPVAIDGACHQPQQQQDGWFLFCTSSPGAAPPESLPLESVTLLLTSLHHLIPKCVAPQRLRGFPSLKAILSVSRVTKECHKYGFNGLGFRDFGFRASGLQTYDTSVTLLLLTVWRESRQ